MTDYVKIVDYAAKDSLITGNPSKLARGTELDNELNAIATAIATKQDSANKGIASGYASLDGSALVPVAQLPAATSSAKGAVELATDAEAITGTDTTRAVTPANLTAAVPGLVSAASILSKLLTVDGSGSGLDADTLDGASSSFFQDASNLNAGVLADARVQQSNVTQHSTALFTSPTLTGTPVAPTAATNTSTTQLATTAFANPGSTFTTDGYTRLPSGLILQWGSYTFGNLNAGSYTNSTSINFPLTFPTAVLAVVAGTIGDATSARAFASSQGTSGFTLQMEEWSALSQGSNCGASWFAIGY